MCVYRVNPERGGGGVRGDVGATRGITEIFRYKLIFELR